jgi:hypothetical protein
MNYLEFLLKTWPIMPFHIKFLHPFREMLRQCCLFFDYEKFRELNAVRLISFQEYSGGNCFVDLDIRDVLVP